MLCIVNVIIHRVRKFVVLFLDCLFCSIGLIAYPASTPLCVIYLVNKFLLSDTAYFSIFCFQIVLLVPAPLNFHMNFTISSRFPIEE